MQSKLSAFDSNFCILHRHHTHPPKEPPEINNMIRIVARIWLFYHLNQLYIMCKTQLCSERWGHTMPPKFRRGYGPPSYFIRKWEGDLPPCSDITGMASALKHLRLVSQKIRQDGIKNASGAPCQIALYLPWSWDIRFRASSVSKPTLNPTLSYLISYLELNLTTWAS